MKKLLKNKKGFTLMEMLIVVAIIVILIAVSMPVFSKSLESTKTAADNANLRAAKAVGVTKYLTEDITTETVLQYNTETGELGATGNASGQNTTNKGKTIYVKIATDGKVTAQFGSF